MAKFGGRNGLAFCRPVHLLKSGHISGIDARNVSREYLGPFGIPQWTLTAAFRLLYFLRNYRPGLFILGGTAVYNPRRTSKLLDASNYALKISCELFSTFSEF